MSVDQTTGQIDWPPRGLTDPDPQPSPPPPRRLRGLRFPVLLSATNLVQVMGGGAAVAGVFMQWGPAVGLMVAGVVSAVLAALHESGKI